MSHNERVRKTKINKEYARVLGTDHYSQAVKILNKLILIKFAKIANKNTCRVCNKSVSVGDFNIGHLQPWRTCLSRNGNKDLFWDIDNINLQHKFCNTTNNNARGKDGYINAEPTIDNSLANVIDYTSKRQLSFDKELLGMDFGKANQRLFRKVMFEYCKLAHQNTCSICNKEITKIEDWTIEHNKPWFSGETDEEKKRLFFDLDNVSSAHIHCNCGKSTIGKGESGYYGVSMHNAPKLDYYCWRSSLRVNGKQIWLKYSSNPVECAEAYDMGVLKYRNGEGLLNFPEKLEEYNKKIALGWGEEPKCKICGGKYFALGYCRKHHYWHAGGREKRLKRYKEGMG